VSIIYPHPSAEYQEDKEQAGIAILVGGTTKYAIWTPTIAFKH
jgi:hypothetical protein